MSDPRRDWAVILARGDSRRMGRPKGLCRLPDDPVPFLVRVARLHAERGVPVIVVTQPGLEAVYREGAPEALVAEWLLHPRGPGTAATVLAAAAALDERASHLWLHPVDLPLVRPETLDRLAARSRTAPGTVWIPRHGARRGHPVLMPLAPWRGLDPDGHTGPMRDLLADGAAPQGFLDVPDPGICHDFDVPGDLDLPDVPPSM